MNRTCEIDTESSTETADMLSIEPDRFLSALGYLEEAKVILRSDQGALYRTTRFGEFVRQPNGLLVDLVSGLSIDPHSVEAIYRVRIGGRETMEIQIRDMGVPLTIIMGETSEKCVWFERIGFGHVRRQVPLEFLTAMGSGAWLDEQLPFCAVKELQFCIVESRFETGHFNLDLSSQALGISIQIHTSFCDRLGSYERLWDASSETVVFLKEQMKKGFGGGEEIELTKRSA